MSKRSTRWYLKDGSFFEWTFTEIRKDRWRPHGIKYRIAWIEEGKCRVLFDNHHGKTDHIHIDGVEYTYHFRSMKWLHRDLIKWVHRLGGKV